ncbi:hypothetical protein LTR05_006068 [Lithohypha guttulata]|uniref:Uncharacterized protein n=1 Tax=Lithohypha guttulata TaxID=1690604 RepID=A0AAN7SXB7_9EURO|nr:hypothetical protein LTR05_006068 [Lithohypha guttulata]
MADNPNEDHENWNETPGNGEYNIDENNALIFSDEPYEHIPGGHAVANLPETTASSTVHSVVRQRAAYNLESLEDHMNHTGFNFLSLNMPRNVGHQSDPMVPALLARCNSVNNDKSETLPERRDETSPLRFDKHEAHEAHEPSVTITSQEHDLVAAEATTAAPLAADEPDVENLSIAEPAEEAGAPSIEYPSHADGTPQAEPTDQQFEGSCGGATQFGSQQTSASDPRLDMMNFRPWNFRVSSRIPSKDTSCLGTPQRRPQSPPQSVLKPQNRDSKVRKVPRRPSVCNSSPSMNGPSSTSLSEEDITLLLFRRRRQQAESSAQLLKSYRLAVSENEQLKIANAEGQQELHDTVSKWHASVKENHVREAELRAFKDKYIKLKGWAQDIAKDYAELKESFDVSFQELKALDTLRAASRTDVEKMLSDCDSAVKQVSILKSEIGEIKAESARSDVLQDKLVQEKTKVREEQLRNKNHAFYIERLETSRCAMQASFSKRQDELTNELTGLKTALEKQDGNMSINIVTSILQALEEIRERAEHGTMDAGELKNLQTLVEKNQEVVKEAMVDIRNGQHDQQAATQLQLSSLVGAIDKLQPDVQYMTTLQRNRAEMAQKMRDQEEFLRSTQREKNTQQLFTAGLLEAHKQIVRRISVAEDQSEKAKSSEQWRSRYLQEQSLASSRAGELLELQSELANTREDLQVKSAEIVELNNNIEEGKNKVKVLEDQLSSKQFEWQKKRKDLAESHQSEVTSCQEQLDTKVSELSQRSSDLQKQTIINDALRSRIAELENLETELNDQLLQRDNQLQEEGRQITALESDTRSLREQMEAMATMNQQINQLQVSTDELAALKTRLDCVDRGEAMPGSDVYQEGSVLFKIQRQLKLKDELAASCKALEDKLTASTNELAKLQHLPTEIQTLQRAQFDISSKYNDVVAKYQDAFREAQKVGGLEHELAECKKEIEDAQSSLKSVRESLITAQHSADQLPKLRRSLEIAERLKTEFEAGMKARDVLIEDLRMKNRENEELVTGLQNRVAKLDDLEEQVEQLQDEARQKSTRLVEMTSSHDALRNSNKKFDLLRHYIDEEHIDQFDEEIILSFKNVINQTQSERRATQDTEQQSADADAVRPPRRAANRGIIQTAEGPVVPDSQSQWLDMRPPEPVQPDPSFDMDDELFEDAFDLEAATQIVESSGQNMRQLAKNVPVNQHEVAHSRPGTASDEMLLRSEDSITGESGSGRTPAEVRVAEGVQTTSPMKTRAGSLIQHGMPMPESQSRVPTTPHANSRASPAPNSAMKRKQTTIAPESAVKRVRTRAGNETDLEGRSMSQASHTSKTTRFDNHSSGHDLSNNSRRSGGVIGTNAPVPGQRKKTNAPAKTTSKHAQYQARFNEGSS